VKFLITGGEGCIGSHAVRKLVAAGLTASSTSYTELE
jgi:nucleoside-diphosphate-sugar epimerase